MQLQLTKERLLSRYKELKEVVNSTMYPSVGIFCQKVKAFTEEAENYAQFDESFHVEHIRSVNKNEMWYVNNFNAKTNNLGKKKDELAGLMQKVIHQFDIIMCAFKTDKDATSTT